jgi:hypothetical protein
LKRLHPLLAAAPLGVLALGLTPTARAQGSDSCATPTLVSGSNPIAFDNTTATQGAEGQGNSACNNFGSTAINHDVWFTWVAPASGTHTLTACGLTGVDTKIAVYNSNGCPAGGAIACNDDLCGSQSHLSFNATIGNTYTFQIGTYVTAEGGPGSFRIHQGTTQCTPGIGPDVIVGDVSDVGNHASVGGIDAISLGTTSCNIGNATIAWQASTPLHPVIGGALYRFRMVDGSGRFEQIGMSWLKHGFTALSGNLCCTCGGGGGSTLGVGCSDPYGSSLNGSQPGLGPRWQVNAHTGVFTYPPANPTWSGSVARRLQYELSDIDTSPGVRYLGECMYITQDDAQAGNGNNNASYRELVVTGTTELGFAISGPTHRTLLAIRAWPNLEPGVTLTDVQVPGDGHFVIGSKATDIGGGMWHYEYAVCNQNSDRNGGWFRVPLPVGANVQNIGFHDVSYRNGDGPGNVDTKGDTWFGVVDAAGIAWECAGPQDPSANAIRWSTTYNFRFDADVAPETGNVTLGLWKTGTPNWMNASAQVPSGGDREIARFCAGDGSGGACPCANEANAGAGTGCKSSLGVGGLLGTAGTPSVSMDSLGLVGSSMPNTSVLYFQGTQTVNGGLGVTFGDGLRCVGGFVKRLGTKMNVLGASVYPSGPDTPVSMNGSCSAGDVRYYQAWYRNTATFCTAETFNYTNGIRVTWLP